MEQLSNKIVKANKSHICDTCGSIILKGETYNNQVNKFDGSLYNWKQCNLCLPITNLMFNEGYYPDGISDTDFKDFVSDYGVDFKIRK